VAHTDIRELARRSGVSVATVSKVLNDYPGVKDETRRRVLELAAELDYTPRAAARTLVTQRSYLIGVILFTGFEHPDLQHPFFQEVLVGLKHRVGALGYDLLIFATEDTGEFGQTPWIRRCRHHGVDGVVLMGVDERDPEVQRLADSRIPCMAIDLDVAGGRTGRVTSDNVAGAGQAVSHLRAVGHERIGLISGPLAMLAARDRLVGYRQALERIGVEYDDGLVVQGDFYVESGYDAMQTLLRLDDPPTAVFAASDLMAVGAIRAVHEAGLRIPDDVAIVGFDDIQLAPLLHPPLTTVRQDKEGLGAAAGQALIHMVEDTGFSPPSITLPTTLVLRETTQGDRSENGARGRGG
jgi:LacI family transcriptional regulator